MADKTLTIVSNGSTTTKTFNRDRFAGVRTLTSGHAFHDGTLQVQVTVAGHANISGLYKRSSTSSNRYRQVNGPGVLEITEIRVPPDNFVEWTLNDGSDNNPSISFQVTGSTNTLPWQGLSEFAANGITLSPFKTITVNRTAPVVTSDRAGESRPILSKVVGGAAAAYSLRDLNDKQGNNKVVRVRRESDNHERDFLAKEISNGTLESFVNSQGTAPLDIQALTATGRDGDFLIAKAAYSLRSLGTRQATVAATGDTIARANGKYVCQVRRNVNGDLKSFTADEVTDGTLVSFVNESFTSSLPLDVQGSAAAAYSLRNLSSSYSGNVVEVRRSSDDTTENFTAAEVTDGTLLSFVTEEVTLLDATDFSSGFPDGLSAYNPAGALATSFGNSIGGSDNTYLAEVVGSGAFQPLRKTLSTNIFVGDTVTFSVEVFLPTSNTSTGIKLITGQLSTSTHHIQVTKGSWQIISVTSTKTGSASNQFRINELINASNVAVTTIGEKIYVRRFKVTVKSSDGFVKTWYDQSGSTNHATQTTAAEQPKIVDAGSLLTAGVTFDGGDSLSVSGDPVITASSSGTYSAFSVQTVATSEAGYLYGNASTSNGSSLYAAVNTFALTDKTHINHDTISRIVAPSGGQNLLSAVYNDGDAGLLVNGAGTMTDAGTYDFSAGTGDFVIGNRNGGSAAATFLIGSINEIIIYDADQSEDRRAIEESISGHYGITLGAFNRDGFVKTWYDQSVTNQAGDTATGNHLTQATSSKQPKIVNAGSLLNELVFDGSDDFLQTSANFDAFGANSLALFTVINPSDVSGNPRFLNTRSSTAGIELISNSQMKLYYKDSSNNGTTGNNQGASLSAGTEVLYTCIVDRGPDQTVEPFKNGSSLSLSNPPDFTGVGSVNAAELTIGANNSGTQGYNGKTKEIIIYASDQTDNRTTIEANIGEHYSISGIPAFDNSVNGFVETWYDQSGNGRDLSQSTISKQPTIVTSGTLNTRNNKPIVKFIQANSNVLLGPNTSPPTGTDFALTCFQALHIDISSGSRLGIFGSSGGGSNAGTSTYRFGSGTSRKVTVRIRDASDTVTALESSALSDDTDSILTYMIKLNDGSLELQTFNLGAQLGPTQTSSVTDQSYGYTHNTILGARHPLDNFSDSEVFEVIFYNSDQLSNRPAIEANLSNQYGIALS